MVRLKGYKALPVRTDPTCESPADTFPVSMSTHMACLLKIGLLTVGTVAWLAVASPTNIPPDSGLAIDTPPATALNISDIPLHAGSVTGNTLAQLIDSYNKNTHDGTVGTPKRRGLVIALVRRIHSYFTRYGTEIFLDPQSGQCSGAIVKYSGQDYWPGASVESNIVMQHCCRDHVVSDWVLADHRIIAQTTVGDAWADVLLKTPNQLLDSTRIPTQEMLNQAQQHLDLIVEPGFYHDPNTDMTGAWAISVATFKDEPGFACTILRQNQGPGVLIQDERAIAAATLLLVISVLDLMQYTVVNNQKLFEPVDAYIGKVMLDIMIDLVREATGAIKDAGGSSLSAPKAQSADIHDALQALGAGVVRGAEPNARFYTVAQSLAKLEGPMDCESQS